MKRLDFLAEVYVEKMSEVEGEAKTSRILSSPEAANIKALLGLSNIEWTAHAQGANVNEIASWRYRGWPQVCLICGGPLYVEDFGWFVAVVDSVGKLTHITCQAGSA
jgi:hypothetical protein